MKPIVRIYTGDLQRIARNWAAAVIVLGLVVLPSLYAWFNILASWDPYSQTGGLPVAVVNRDQGASMRGKALNLGNDITESLKDNRNIGWTFTGEEQAIRGVEHGDYYACIIIPDNFSAMIGTVLSDNPQKAELVYYVNEKINAVSPKITGKGASGIIEQVNRAFIQTANGTIFRIFNDIGIELQTELPTILTLRDAVFRLEAMLPEIGQALATAAADIGKAEEIVAAVQARLPVIAQLAKDGEQLADRLASALESGSKAAEAAGPDVLHNLQLLKATADAAVQLTELLRDGNADTAIVSAGLERLSRRLAIASDVSGSLLALMERLAGFAGQEKLMPATTRLGQVRTAFQRLKTSADAARTALGKGEKPSEELIAGMEKLSREASDLLGDVLSRYKAEIQPAIVQGLDKARQPAQAALVVLQEANRSIPDVQRIVGEAAEGLAVGHGTLQDIIGRMPAASDKIKGLADRIRAMERQGSLEELIGLLRKDASKESEFFAEPVVLQEHRLFPIPNYGSAMSPFFSTLSLWVGALLLVSLLTVEAHPEGEARSHHVYFGRFLTFGTLAILQSFCVTIGDIWLLGTYVADPGAFILYGALISAVFMCIVYTLVSVFGNVGKALAIVLLVLQLSGSGGTFPIQVTPAFFQAIHPFLPFTYAISMMREAVGGIVRDVVVMDLCMLGVFALLALVVGLSLKEWINRAGAKLVRKAKESGMIH
ncbi:YhgE/Pip domain-containing protein [Paenibacillus hemerocallicola]|uniref:YhgE/Pip domain-containing protein n=1 Tax=Paenibacillus hemerocallicola TaxID=1172614 RepID=A0A5C4SYC4_9BACL|nr:YhgE/Pip domain-containing protein [Paenibacillus hemerocallicola]TNJ61541.1 YhgE/Pip domain-containing protein [Paenibacillus hemerocallicola]